MKSVSAPTDSAGAALGAQDVRALLRLVHDLHDEQVPLSVRLGTLSRQLCVLTRARRCQLGIVDSTRGVWPLDLTLCAEFGWMNGSDVRLMMSALDDDQAVDAMAMEMVGAAEAGEARVQSGTAIGMLGADGWRKNRLYDLYLRPVGVDDVLQSRVSGVLGARQHGWIALVRDRAEGAFTERDAQVVDALQAEIGSWLWKRVRAELARNRSDVEFGVSRADGGRSAAELLARLSPTQRKILPYLLKGCTEEEIALDLSRSRHTVHDHVKRIYDSLGVKSRIDLVITFQNAGWDSRGAGVEAGVLHSGR